MHISDGILPAQVWASAAVASGGLAAVLLARTDAEKIPRVALCTSFFFVASLVHVPLGPTSVHLLLIGLVGIVMGSLAFLPILFGVVLQTLLFQHGGVTTIGVNALMMGLPAYAAYGVFRLRRGLGLRRGAFGFGFLAGGLAVLLAGVLLAAFLALAGESFHGVAAAALVAHMPVAAAEGVVAGFTASFLSRTEPGILEAAGA
jgi:cobalt/nickel transport system permease protein